MLKSRVLAHMLFASLVFFVSACSQQRGTGINISGSTSVSPFIEHLVEIYEREHAGGVINVQSLGSTAGIQAAMSQVAEIGMSSRELKKEEAGKLDQLVIARDALAIVVHPSNPVQALTLQQVQEIFAGKITNWSQLGGTSKQIVVIVREAGSGTFGAFDELVMKSKSVSVGALRQGSNGAIRQVVSEDANAIGYISLGIVDSTVRALPIDGVTPSVEQVLAKKYKFVRPFLFVWPKGKKPTGLASEFMTYVMSPSAQAEFEKLGLVPAGG